MIENLDKLTPEQLEKVKKQLTQINSSIEEQQAQPIADFFNKHGWVKIDKIINKETADLFYLYCLLATERLNVLEQIEGIGNVNPHHYGRFDDPQATGDYSKYGDLIFDTLLYALNYKMNLYTGIDLVPTYSYHRLYTKGTELKKHSDRPSCEISTTLCLGFDNSNLDKSKYENYMWPLYVKEKDGTELPINLRPGDMLIYKGCELEHWREPFIGNNHAQVFLHYNDKKGPHNIKYDGRPFLGMISDEKTTIY
tara:strand:- start:2271 stop:3029 length:759 start_codon:yes stop_codon:yes gene_type:complete